MSDPAVYVFVRDGHATVHYDKYGKWGVVYNFVSAKTARKYGGSAPEVDWINDCAEAGFLLNYDSKHAVVFGQKFYEESTEPVNKKIDELLDVGSEKYLDYIRPRWQGWTIEWDEYFDFRSYIRENALTSKLRQPNAG